MSSRSTKAFLIVLLFLLLAACFVTALPSRLSREVVTDHLNRLEARLPAPVARLRWHDKPRFLAHVALGQALVPFDTKRAGVQWIKAAAHARSADEVDQVADGLIAVKQRSPSVKELEGVLCPYLSTGASGVRQRVALEEAGLSCQA